MNKKMLGPTLVMVVLALTLGACASATFTNRCPSWTTWIGNCSAYLDYSYNNSTYSVTGTGWKVVQVNLIGDAIVNDVVNTKLTLIDGTIVNTDSRLKSDTYLAQPIDNKKPWSFTFAKTNPDSGTFAVNVEYVAQAK